MIKAVIIDDEKASAELLEIKLKKADPGIVVSGVYTSATTAFEALEYEEPDVIFLDIEMPRLDGISFVKKLTDGDTEIIFTTAHSQYAVEAIKQRALDYLLKPIDENELETAITRLRQKMTEKEKLKASWSLESMIQKMQSINTRFNKIAIATLEDIQFIPVGDIIRVESQSNYSIIYLTGGKKLVASKTLRILEEMLMGYRFFRPHKSHLVNLDYIARYIKTEGGWLEMADGSKVEVSRQRKREFLRLTGEI
jgi:two-component system LytT family response regulator